MSQQRRRCADRGMGQRVRRRHRARHPARHRRRRTAATAAQREQNRRVAADARAVTSTSRQRRRQRRGDSGVDEVLSHDATPAADVDATRLLTEPQPAHRVVADRGQDRSGRAEAAPAAATIAAAEAPAEARASSQGPQADCGAGRVVAARRRSVVATVPRADRAESSSRRLKRARTARRRHADARAMPTAADRRRAL